MDVRDIRSMTDENLAAALGDAHQEMFNLRFQKATGRLGDPSRMRHVRRDVARLLTVRRERELWAAYEAYVSSQNQTEEA
jgi:large subunit ribosomal protein L29